MHHLACGGMWEGEFGGMEAEAFGGFASVEAVTDDRCIESEGVRGMDAELVGASGEGEEIHEDRAVRPTLADEKTGEGRFAMLHMDHLSGTVVGVGEERQVNKTC